MLFRKCLLLVLNEKNSFENNKNRELRLVANLPPNLSLRMYNYYPSRDYILCILAV